MKKLMIIAIALFTLNGMAQEDNKRLKDKKERLELRQEMTPKDIANLKSKRLTLELDLTDAQQKQVYDLILKDATERQITRKEREANKDKNIKPSKEALIKQRNQRLDKAIAMKRELKTILTAEQFEEFEKMKSKIRRKRTKRKLKNPKQ